MEQGVSFGRYRFEFETARLWSGESEVRLTPKASAVLRVLVTNAGKPVSREELFASVWNGTAVTDDALTTCIQELRKALADDVKQPRFIETRHRRGYRFVARLDQSAEAAAATKPQPGTSAIAVLPFADMSPARDQDYLCEGLADELIKVLTQITGLRVASRTASFRFRSTATDVQAIGRHLGVETLLEGSVRKADDRLRVTVQLVDVATGYAKWSQRYDRTLDDVFAIQEEIAESVAATLRGGVLSRREKQALARPHTGVPAYEYYLRGRQYLPRMTAPDLKRSAEMFGRAIELDAGYGPAWACMGAAYATLYEWFGAKEEDMARAERASQKALELAPRLAESHISRGCALSLSRQYEQAAHEFEEAIRLNPSFFEGYYYYGRIAFATGDIERSAELFGKAKEVRQEDFQSAMLQGQSLRMLGRTQEAQKATREGIRRAERILVLNPLDARALSLGAGALFHDGQIDRAREWSKKAIELYPEDAGVLINGACLHAKLREKEPALQLLERVFTRGWGKRDWIEHDPDYEIMRDDPRFQKLLEKLS